MMGNLIYNRRFIPPVPDMEIKKNITEVPPLIQSEDKIINTFCKKMGGYIKAMPLIQAEINKIGMDFENPSREELETLIRNLYGIMDKKK